MSDKISLVLRFKGGRGSGNFNHSGRPGSVGGSSSGSGAFANSSKPASAAEQKKSASKFRFEAKDRPGEFEKSSKSGKIKTRVKITTTKKGSAQKARITFYNQFLDPHIVNEPITLDTWEGGLNMEKVFNIAATAHRDLMAKHGDS